MSAKGKEFRVSTSVDRKTALGNSKNKLPNVMYFPTDDSNSIIFNGRIYDLNGLITTPVVLGGSENLNAYKGISNAGVYVGNSGNEILNKPSDVDAFILQAFSYLPNEIHYQILYSGDKIYSRRYIESSSSWTPWKKFNAEGLTSIPKATTSALGGVMLGYANTGQNYKLEVDSDGKAFVHVPWTDNNTTYGLATTNTDGLLKQLSGNTSQYMRGDGTWATPPNTTYNLVGAIGSTGLIKNGSSVTNDSGYTACPIISGVPYYKDTTYLVATESSPGLMSASDKRDFNEINSNWLNGGVFVNENSSLYNLATMDGSPSKMADELAMFSDDGTLSNSKVTLNQIALVNKSNVWSVYQDFKAGAGNSGSDMRFKKEVEPVTSISESIAKLDIIQYIWEHPDEERIRNTFGVKADQLLELGGIFATMVHNRGDKYKTKWVEYDRFGVLAIKAIQELLKRLEQCETKIAELEAKL